jgi:hypothetical protein
MVRIRTQWLARIEWSRNRRRIGRVGRFFIWAFQARLVLCQSGAGNFPSLVRFTLRWTTYQPDQIGAGAREVSCYPAERQFRPLIDAGCAEWRRLSSGTQPRKGHGNDAMRVGNLVMATQRRDRCNCIVRLRRPEQASDFFAREKVGQIAGADNNAIAGAQNSAVQVWFDGEACAECA